MNRRRTNFGTYLVCLAIFLASTSLAATYTYDNLNRLTHVDYGNGNTIQYTYDQAGNRLTETVTGTASVDPDPQVAAQPLTVPLVQGGYVRISWSDFGGPVEVSIWKGDVEWLEVALNAADDDERTINTAGWEARADYRAHAHLVSDVGVSAFSGHFTVEVPTGDVWRVNPDGSGDFATIQDALNAGQSGDVILLGDGVVTGTGNRDLNFQGKQLTLRSFSGNPGSCTIDVGASAASPAQGIIFGELEPVGTSVEYIRFVNGYHSQGGAIAVYGSQVTLVGCVFEDNTASSIGGAVHLSDYNRSIVDCEFRNNNAVEGGAIYLGSGTCSFEGSLFEGNSANFGGAIRIGGTPVILTASGNVFRSNSAGTNGSAIMTRRDDIDIVDNLFAGNLSGGADLAVLYIEPWTQPQTVPVIADNTFLGNEGTAISSAYELDMLVERNILAYSTYFGMSCVDGGTGEHAQLSCNVFFGNGSGDAWCGDDLGGNVVADPLFCNPGGVERTVADSSPCLPANNSCGVTIGGVAIDCDEVTGLEEPQIASAMYSLHQASPNPFNPRTCITFELPRREAVTLRVFDLTGRMVKTLIDIEIFAQGRQEVIWLGRDDGGRQCASGTYFYRLEVGNYVQTKKMVLIK